LNRSDFLDACLARSRGQFAVFRWDEVMRLYEYAGHKLSGNIPRWITLRWPIVSQLVEMARAHA
jgi:hypothetical protein